MLSHVAKSSRMMGSYIRIFSCQLGRLQSTENDRGCNRTALVIWLAKSGRLDSVAESEGDGLVSESAFVRVRLDGVDGVSETGRG